MTDARQAMLDAARAVLRPLVRLLIGRGVTYPAFSHLVKEVYIDVARRHFALPFKQQTDSRVALVTGITRKEIGQIRRGQAPPPAMRIALDHPLAARVAERWLAGPPYTAADGTPHLLAYESPQHLSFVDLVAELGGDIPPRAVLDELLRTGAATLTPRGHVRLAAHAAGAGRGGDEDLEALRGEFADGVARALAAAQPRPPDDGTP
jgi:hypothetical protein